VVSYQRVNRDLAQMKGCLAAGYPFVFGFTVYESFESPAVKRTGVLNLPAPAEAVVGGHAVLAVGYDDTARRFIARNSWSAKWGQQGYFTIPYAYLMAGSLARDFWTIRMVEG
jgi:C1A family cysteine protease